MIISLQPSELFVRRTIHTADRDSLVSKFGWDLSLSDSRATLFSHTRRRAHPDAASRTAPHRLLNDPSRLADFVPYASDSLLEVAEVIVRSRGGRRMHLSTRYVLTVLSIGATRDFDFLLGTRTSNPIKHIYIPSYLPMSRS